MLQAQPYTSVSSDSVPQTIERPPFVVADDEVEFALFAPQLRIPRPEEAPLSQVRGHSSDGCLASDQSERMRKNTTFNSFPDVPRIEMNFGLGHFGLSILGRLRVE